jgi:hypothetical protein
VQFLEPFTAEIAAEHQLVAPGEVAITDEHYGLSRPDRPRRARTAAEKQLLALGDPAAAFLTGAAAAGVSGLHREISQILTLQAWRGHSGAHLEACWRKLLARSDPTDVTGARRARVARVHNNGRAGIRGRDRQ